MSEQPPYPPSDPDRPQGGSTPPPPPGGYGTPPPGGHGTPPPGDYGPPPPAPGGYGAPPPGASYDVIEAIKYGWRKFADNWGPFVVLALLAIALPGVISAVGSLLSSGGSSMLADPMSSGNEAAIGSGFSVLGALFNLVGQIVSVFFMAALIRAGLDAAEGRPVEIGAAFTRWSFLHVALLAVLVAIGSAIGLLLCILPGIVFIFFTWFGNYFVVGRGQNAIEAIGSSMKFTAANIGPLLLLALLSFLIGIAGVLACLVGLLVAVPVITIAAAYTFKVLHGEPVAP